MATKDTLQADSEEYGAAFNEEMLAPVEQTEDEAFGLTPEMPAEATAESPAEPEGEAPSLALTIDPAEAADAPADAAAPADVAAEAPAEAAEPSIDIAKEEQRLRSWEGRLKALEKQLKAQGGEGAGEAIEDVAEDAEAAGDTQLADAAEAASEAVEAGEMTADQAMKMLAEDFGEDFVKMIEAIATAKAKEAGAAVAGEKVAEVGKTVDEIISSIVDERAKAHFERIADAHPDFNDIGQSPEFSSWIASLPEAEKADAERVAAGGTAKEIIKLLDTYKAQASKPASSGEGNQVAQTDPAVDAAMDAAEGVRSSGLKLPEEPAKSDGYEDAWKEFA
jgi:hypothetical protein